MNHFYFDTATFDDGRFALAKYLIFLCLFNLSTQSRAHELVVFRYASRVLHRSFAALQSRRHRGAAMSRLRELRERIATIAPDRVSRLVGLGISRLLATELLRLVSKSLQLKAGTNDVKTYACVFMCF
jgi:hypothetical protein